MRLRWCVPVIAGALALATLACDNGGSPAKPVVPPPPACPSLEDFLHTVAIGRAPGGVLGAAVSGDVAFAAAGTDGVRIFDVSDPADVRLLTTIPITDARAVDVEGTMLYVAAANDGLILVDVSNPSAAAIVGGADLPGCTVDVDAAGTRVYVANDDIGLAIVDVSNPAVPVVRGIENTPGRAVAVAASEPLVFVADELNGLRIVNAADPAAPFIVKTVAMPGAARGVAVSGDIVAVAAREGKLQLVDASLPGFASIVGSYATSRDALSVALSGTVAFVAQGSGGIEVVDIATPASPVRMQSIGTASIARDVAVFGAALAVAEDLSGVRVVSIAVPASPAIDAYLPGGNIQAVVAMGDLLVVADASFGLRVFDPATRGVVGEIAIAGFSRDLAVADSIAYGAGDGNVPVVDLRDPTQPVALPAISAGGPFDGVAVADAFIYLLASTGTLVEQRLDGTGVPRTLNINGPYLPSLTIEDPYVYLPDRQGQLYVVVRSTMRLASVIPMGASAERVVFRRTDGPFGPVVRGWVAQSGLTNGRAALEVYNFADIIFPTLVGTMPCSGNAVDVAFAGAYVAVAQGSDGCEIFQLTGETTARPVGFFPETSLRVASFGGGFAVAAGASGLLLIGLDGCWSAR